MASTYTTSLRIEKPGAGEQSGSWGSTVNTSYDLMEKAVAGFLAIATADANVTLTANNGSSDQARNAVLEFTGTNTATREVIVPAVSKVYVIKNSTTQSITVKTSGGTGPTILTGKVATVFCDATNVYLVGVADTVAMSALAAVTAATDTLPYFTSSSAASTTSLTSFARTILDDTDASTARSTLGLVIGTNVQAFSSVLSTYAGINPAANVQSILSAADYSAIRSLLSLVVGTNVQAYNANLTTYAGITPSANVQSLLGAANYSAMRTLLSLVPGTDVQAYSSVLATYAGISPAANTQTFLGAANYAAMRTQLSLVPGTDVQAYTAVLNALSSVPIGSDLLPYFSGAATATSTTFTSFARSLVGAASAADARTLLGVSSSGTSLQVANNLSDLNNAATARTNLGLGTAAVVNTGTSGATIPLLDGNNTWSGAQVSTGSLRFGDGGLIIRTAGAAANSSAYFQTSDGVNRFVLGINDVDDSMFVNRYNSSGVYQDTPFAISSAGVLSRAGYQIADENNTVTLSNKTLSSPTLSGTVAGSPTWTGTHLFDPGAVTVPLQVGPAYNGGVAYNTGNRQVIISAWTGTPSLSFIRNNINTWTTGVDSSGHLTVTDGGTASYKFTSANAFQINSVAVPTISSTDTFTNKTLSSPTLSGTVAGSPTFSGNLTISSTSVPLTVNSSNNAYVLGISYASAAGGYIGSTGAGNLRLTDSTIATILDVNTAKVLVTGTLQAQKTSSAASPTTSSNSITNVIFRVAASNVGAAGYGVDFGVSNADGTSWIQSRDHNDYATNTALKLNPNGGTVTANGYTVADSNNTLTLTNKTLSSPTLSGTIAGAASWSGIQTLQQQVNIGSGVASGGVPFHIENSTVTTNKMGGCFQGTGTAFTFVPYDGGSYSTSDEFGYDFTSNVWFFDSATVNLAGSPIVSRSATETLSNKTISSPTLSGTIAGTPTVASAWTWTSAQQIRPAISSEASGSLTSVSANKSVACTGGITLANSVFTAGDMIVLDPGTSSRTITRGSGVTMYVNGTDSASATLAANKMGGVYWRSASVCVLSGAVS